MRNFSVISLILICIAIIFAAGCTSSRSTSVTQLTASTPEYTYQLASVSPTHFSGSASDTQAFTVTRGGGFILTGSHSGKRNFIVNLQDNNGESMGFGVFNAIGSYTGKKVVHLDPGKYFLEVMIADGPWTVDISPT